MRGKVTKEKYGKSGDQKRRRAQLNVQQKCIGPDMSAWLHGPDVHLTPHAQTGILQTSRLAATPK